MSLDDLYGKPGHLFRRCQQIAVSLFLEECAGSDITPIQYAVLSALEEGDGRDQVTLSGLVAIDRSTMANVLARLEKRGLVRRRPDPNDQRVKLATLTAQGRQLHADLAEAVERVQTRLLAPLRPADRAALLDALAQIAEAHNEQSRVPLRAAVRKARG